MPTAKTTQGVPVKAAKTRERFNRDDNVIAAAISVMSDKGYASTSIQEVAERVGVLKGSLYHYFSSKEELLYRILEESHEQSREIHREVIELDLPPLETLLLYVRRLSVWYLANVERANIFFTEMKHLTGDRQVAAAGWGRAFERDISDQVVAGQADRSIRDDIDQRLLTRFILGAVNNVRFWPSRRSSRQFDHDAIVDALVALVGDSIRAS
ncbi:TetR/AcrR family transcriptional regulator [Paenarthrobacter aromaticivorans]|uniref:TetR/AcrR family transcriptional regulator n=1 Tax=Paenarthrobacter aromaticivorans TaxID=2849150 RepID=A0ABS6I1L3_9MICC|nr:TetR/AcrR family transcriptional regulator [Paenarthrobacter sp. MMS21-TAE1-1]MBU8865623.1 TetR/AcrR family transcriptional regulator [Paenarthrobacter sp. MMS21-TAE1-1]